MNKLKHIPRDIKFLMSESALTSFILFMPVAYLLFSDIGLDLFEIGLLQTVYMATLLILDIPTGYLADRISLKLANAFGDIFTAVGVFIYFGVRSFWVAVLAEVIFGVGRSLTSGADSALLRGHSKKAGLSYEKLAARMESINFTMSALGAIVGAWIGSVGIRWPFLVQGVLFLVAAFLAFYIKNAGTQRKNNTNPFKDLVTVVKYCVHGHPKLFGRMLFGSMLTTSTYFLVWFLTPIFLQSGVEVAWHGFLFAALALASAVGSEFIAKRNRLAMATPLLFTFIAFLILGVHISVLTIPLILLVGFARGVNNAKVKPYIQELTPDDMQATSISVFGVLYRVGAGVLGLLVNYLGSVELQVGLLSAAIICLVSWVVFKFSKLKQ
ncbi:MAG: MFS family permease [Candidatus Saccharimonadales bacterium]|jgi:MFS family permease